jgi:DNA-binding response OmpR family regulator
MAGVSSRGPLTDEGRSSRQAGPSQGRLLLVDDELRLTELLARLLTRRGYEVAVAHDGISGLHQAQQGNFDIVLLDVMLPGLSGYRVLERLRAEGHDVPVLMLTAKDGEYDEADALDLGADDYVTKPFSSIVLTARLAALLRRRAGTVAPTSVGRLSVAPEEHRVRLDGQVVPLAPREFELLAYLVVHRDMLISKQELLDEVWHEPYADANIVEVCVAQLRRKLGPRWIETVRNAGYRFVDPDLDTPDTHAVRS